MKLGMPFLLENKTVEESCALCAELGLDFVELNGSFPTCLAEKLTAAELLRMKEQYGVGFTFHLPEEADPFAFDKPVQHAWRLVLRDFIQLAKDVGAPVLNMHLPQGVYVTLPQGRLYMNQQYGIEYMAAVNSFRDAVDAMLRGTGTRLCIENTNGFMPHEWLAIDVLLESQCFGLTLDVGHDFCIDGKDLPGVMKRKHRLHHMHLHDATGKHPHLALGDGELDLSARLALAEETASTVVLEIKTIAALRQSIDWLKQQG